jgi:hypothetical protein
MPSRFSALMLLRSLEYLGYLSYQARPADIGQEFEFHCLVNGLSKTGRHIGLHQRWRGSIAASTRRATCNTERDAAQDDL